MPCPRAHGSPLSLFFFALSGKATLFLGLDVCVGNMTVQEETVSGFQISSHPAKNMPRLKVTFVFFIKACYIVFVFVSFSL